jgi:hypothetical protein
MVLEESALVSTPQGHFGGAIPFGAVGQDLPIPQQGGHRLQLPFVVLAHRLAHQPSQLHQLVDEALGQLAPQHGFQLLGRMGLGPGLEGLWNVEIRQQVDVDLPRQPKRRSAGWRGRRGRDG